MATTAACLDEEMARRYLADGLDEAEAADVEDHVERCAACQERLDRLAGATPAEMSRLGRPSAQLPEALLSRLEGLPLWDAHDDEADEGWPAGSPPDVPGYAFVRELGRGGAGVVYLAEESGLGRQVALKMILLGRHATRDQRRRFQAEARLVGRLRHPNLVQVYQVGEHDGLPFCAMEYLEGGNLRERMAREPLAPREAAALTALLADAVQAVHAAGIVHRDLKPENVLLAADGTPRVADFGHAHRPDDDGPSLTRSGQLVGTPRYMAPEQAADRDERSGPAVDVYALGAMLYEMLAGAPPFRGATLAQTLAQVIAREPEHVRKAAPDVPLDLETICLCCLRKEPHRRYSSAAALADDLRRFLDGRPVAARPVSRLETLLRWCRRRPALATLLGLVAALVAALAVGGPIVASREAMLAETLGRQAHALEDANRQLSEARALAEARAADARARYVAVKNHVGHQLGVLDDSLKTTQDILPAREKLIRGLVEIQRRFVEGGESSPEDRYMLAMALERRGALSSLQGRFEEAAAGLGEAVELLDAVIAEEPARVDYREQKIYTTFALGTALKMRNRHDEARRAYQAAIDVSQELDAKLGTPGARDNAVGETHTALGMVASDQGRFVEAEREYRLAMTTADWQVAEGYDHAAGAAARARISLGGALVRGHEFAEAERTLCDLLRLAEQRLAADPGDPFWREMHGGAYGGLAGVPAPGAPAETERRLREAVRRSEEAVTERPTVAHLRDWDLETRRALIRHLEKVGREDEAAAERLKASAK